jgi:endonuclease I
MKWIASLYIGLFFLGISLQDIFAFPLDSQTVSKPSASTSFSQSKKKLMKLYLKAGKTKTLYCGCSFNADKGIDNSSCGYVPRKKTIPM